MALKYLKNERDLALRGSILLTDGSIYELTADNVVRYVIDEASTAGESITLGDTRAADFDLEIEDAAHALTAALLIGARVTVEIGLDGAFDPLGVWYADSAQISRQSATVAIRGSDALAAKMDSLFVDGTYPATLGEIARRAAEQAGVALAAADFRNAGVSVQTKPEWDPETNTLRAVIGYIAGCAGGFARINRAGELEIVAYNEHSGETITADYFTTLAVGGGRSFAFNCLQVAYFGTNIYARYAIDESRTDTAGDTLRVSDNPLFTPEIAQSLVAELTGLESSAVSVDWIGDPAMLPGTLITVQDTDGSLHSGIATRQMIVVDGGLHAQTSADLPSDIESTFAGDTLFTPAGRVNVQAIEGRLKVWAENEIDIAVGGKADAGDVDALKAQMALVPGQITAEVSGALASYTPTQVIDGSRLIITKDQFSIDTPLFRVNVSGVDGDMMLDMFGLSIAKVNSPSVHAQYDGPTGLTVGGVVDGEKVFATLADAFAKLNGRHIPARVVITMAADTVEEAELRQTTGASVVILGNGHTVSGRVTLSDVPNRFYMYDLKINNGSTADCLYLTSSGPAMLENCVFTANSYKTANAYGNGLQVLESQAEANGCTFNGGYAGVFATTNSRVFLQSCKGEQNKYGIYARNNASVGVLTSRPNGDTGVYCRADSVVRGASDAGSGSDSAVVTPTVTTTAALTLTASRTHDGGGWYSGTNVIAQGKTSDGGNYKGCMWFDVSAISGKTIKAATLTLYRNAGVGSGNNVTVRIGTMSNTGPSGGVATVTANDVVVGTVGQKEWLSVSTAEIVAAVQQMASGAAKGLYIWGPAAAYANFAGYGSANAPGLTVTYQ